MNKNQEYGTQNGSMKKQYKEQDNRRWKNNKTKADGKTKQMN